MLNRRDLLRSGALAGAALAVPSLAGCGSSSDALTFFFQAAPDEATVRMQIIEAFTTLYPEIKVQVQMSGPDPNQQILTYAAGGKCPDVVMQWESYSHMVELGILENLDSFLDADPAYAARLRADGEPALYEMFRYRGGQYVLPEQWAGIFLYYNRKLFEEAGVQPPPGRWEDAWTFEEFLAAARALTKRDSSGKATQWGFVDAWPVPRYSAAIFGMNNGGEWFVPPTDPQRTGIDGDEFIEGFQFYADLSGKYGVAPRSSDSEALPSIELFSQGKAAMVLTGHWQYSAMLAVSDLDFDVTVLPVGPHGHGAKSDIGTTGLAISATSPRKELAWEFVKFATGPEGQQAVAKSGLFVPALKSALHSEDFAKAHSKIRNLEVLTGGPSNSNPIPVTPNWARIDDAYHRAADHILRGAAPATYFKGDVTRHIEDLLRSSE
ncbi:sugar ABC transporter substrate-binding protein [Nocardia sp. CA2R105]|uniref:ABC transporter substrate-binding protein n=1 Tax=Nocardia coffeae TaxID=2873381 RepID=UPI001CA628B0|nr:sugar ABC transporter substrate-binding protein [Nocardia coffeae]MBY8858426.1 sugar ABC transporter substrate-binding protein [Nocardia coffeae]